MAKLDDSKKMHMLLEALGETANSISKKLGYKSHQTIYHILNGTNGISNEMGDRIVKKFPNVNKRFLTNDETPIILDERATHEQVKTFGIIDKEGDEFLQFKRMKAIPDQLDRIENMLEKLLGNGK